MMPIKPGSPEATSSLYDECIVMFIYVHYTTHKTSGFTFSPKVEHLSVLFKDTGVTTGTQTHTLLNKNTRALVRCSYLLGHNMPVRTTYYYRPYAHDVISVGRPHLEVKRRLFIG